MSFNCVCRFMFKYEICFKIFHIPPQTSLVMTNVITFFKFNFQTLGCLNSLQQNYFWFDVSLMKTTDFLLGFMHHRGLFKSSWWRLISVLHFNDLSSTSLWFHVSCYLISFGVTLQPCLINNVGIFFLQYREIIKTV